MKTATALGSALLMALAGNPAGAQTRVGLMGGVNRSSYNDTHEDAVHSSRVGFAVGGVLDLSITDAVGLRVEPLYIQKGGSVEDAALREEATLKASMLEVPLLVTLGFGETTRPYLLAGPTVGVMLTSDVSGSDSGISYVGHMMGVTERFDVGVGVGGGLSHGFDRLTAFVEGRYVWGLTNLMKGGEVELSSPGTSIAVTIPVDEEDDRYDYRGLQILFGLTVPLGSGGG